MPNKLRVVIITTKLPEDIWLVNNLVDVCQVAGIVLPTGKRYREYNLLRVFRKRLFRDGPLALADQALLIVYRLMFENRRDHRALKRIFRNQSIQRIKMHNMAILETENVNSPKVAGFLRSISPDLSVVSGAPLLEDQIIAAAGQRMINLHQGYAPQYRGRYGAYWPIYNREPDLVGVTIHYVDNGIDTGKILVRQKVDFEARDTLKTIAYRQQAAGVEFLVKTIQDFGRIAANAYYDRENRSRNYRAMGLSHYLRARRWLRTAGDLGIKMMKPKQVPEDG